MRKHIFLVLFLGIIGVACVHGEETGITIDLDRVIRSPFVLTIIPQAYLMEQIHEALPLRGIAKGKLKATAQYIQGGFQYLEQKKNIDPETAATFATIAGKTVTGAIAAFRVGRSFQAGILGGVISLVASLGDDVRARLVHAQVGKEVQSFLKEAIHIVSPVLQYYDPSLTHAEADFLLTAANMVVFTSKDIHSMGTRITPILRGKKLKQVIKDAIHINANQRVSTDTMIHMMEDMGLRGGRESIRTMIESSLPIIPSGGFASHPLPYEYDLRNLLEKGHWSDGYVAGELFGTFFPMHRPWIEEPPIQVYDIFYQAWAEQTRNLMLTKDWGEKLPSFPTNSKEGVGIKLEKGTVILSFGTQMIATGGGVSFVPLVGIVASALNFFRGFRAAREEAKRRRENIEIMRERNRKIREEYNPAVEDHNAFLMKIDRGYNFTFQKKIHEEPLPIFVSVVCLGCEQRAAKARQEIEDYNAFIDRVQSISDIRGQHAWKGMALQYFMATKYRDVMLDQQIMEDLLCVLVDFVKLPSSRRRTIYAYVDMMYTRYICLCGYESS